MAATVSIQETTIAPATGGVAVRLYVSDRPRAEEAAAALRLDLFVPVPLGRRARVALVQMKAIETLQELLVKLRQELQPDTYLENS